MMRSMVRPLVSPRSLGALAATTAVVLTFVAGPGPAHAAGGTARQVVPASVRTHLSRTDADVARVRHAVASNSFLSRMGAPIGMGAHTVPSHPAVPRPSASEIRSLHGVPAAIRASVAGLEASALEAQRIVRRHASPTLARALIAAMARRFIHTRTVRVGDAIPGAAASIANKVGMEFVSSKHAPAILRSQAVREAVLASARAALLMGAALDRYLPAIRSYRADGGQGTAAAECDMADQAPALCVGSAADNTYTKRVLLRIDLGGNDTYDDGAGSADAGAGINIDLAGNDTYRTGPPAASTESIVTYLSEGSAVAGLGLLVDLAGNDVYSIEAEPGVHSMQAAVEGQGFGGGGYGMLYDGGGNDSYSLAGADQYMFSGTSGQGSSSAGIGTLIDQGAGNDTYAATAWSQGGGAGLGFGSGNMMVQGVGFLGQGLLADDGGTDSYSAVGRIAWVPAPDQEIDEFNGIPDYGLDAPIIVVAAQGVTNFYDAPGYLLEGDGATSYNIDVQGTGVTREFVMGQGAGEGAAYADGVLDDRGGNDTYAATASTRFSQDISVSDPCTNADGSACTAASAFVNHNLGASNILIAQGAAWDGNGAENQRSLGLLHDHAGDDTYTAAGENALTVTLHDRLAAPTGPPSLTVMAPISMPQLAAQGASIWATDAALLDDAGKDGYTVRFTEPITATATSDHATGNPSVTGIDLARLGVAGQGAVFGYESDATLVDAGGDGDSFIGSATLPVNVPAGSGRALVGGYPYPSFQGSAGATPDGAGLVVAIPGYVSSGVGTFFAGGTNPTVVATPSQVTCAGTPGPRGSGLWSECVGVPAQGADHEGVDFYGRGLGYAPNAIQGEPQFTFTPETPGTGAVNGPPLAVGARLVNGGTPVAGAPVHFVLQALPTPSDPYVLPTWTSVWSVDGVTGADGVATAALPLADDYQMISSFGTGTTWRLFATFDGSKTIKPMHVAKAFTPA